MSGMNARSWATSMPSITRLDSVPIRPCACSALSTTSVLDSDTSAPSQTDSTHPSPSQRQAARPRPWSARSGWACRSGPRGGPARGPGGRARGRGRTAGASRRSRPAVPGSGDRRPRCLRCGDRHDPGDEVPEHQWLAQQARQHAAREPGSDDDEEIGGHEGRAVRPDPSALTGSSYQDGRPCAPAGTGLGWTHDESTQGRGFRSRRRGRPRGNRRAGTRLQRRGDRRGIAAEPWGTNSVMPADLVKELSGADKPVVVCTAPAFLYRVAHIPAPSCTARRPTRTALRA